MEQKLAQLGDVADKTFDFVIVGGGLSGCVLASRLSENPDVSVALLEAGKAYFDDPLVDQVDGWMQVMLNPEYDWLFRTTPQDGIANSVTTPDGKPTHSFYWSRGKGLGGSTLINFLLWTRPQREEIDAVEKLGNQGWNWERFFEASKRAERFCAPSGSAIEEYRALYKAESVGHDGPIPVSFARTSSGIELVFQQALAAQGINTITDALGGEISGTWRAASIIDPKVQTRSHAAKGYIYPALGRPNFEVLTEAFVRRVLTKQEGEELVATGVEFQHGGHFHIVNAGKEVILNAGTVKSPHILELSGIGDRAILAPLGIPVQLDLPSVGTNLQDHLILSAYAFEMRVGYDFMTSDTIKLPEFQSKLRQAYGDASGPFSLALSGATFLPLHTFSDRADALIQAQEHRLAENASKLLPGLKEQYEMQLELLRKSNVPDIEILVFPFSIPPNDSGKPYVGILPSIGHPFSRGTIHASSVDPAIQPTIEPNYFSEEIDLEILVDALQFLRKVTAAGPWKDAAEQEVLPGPSVASDEQIREYVKHNLSTTWHSVGTCTMMPKDKGGVVDTKLKVYGTKNLRVADLSILPIIPSVHTQATTYGIAEQAADIIKADYGL
ncbi:GMC oxidoreductase [Trametes versicolor FP-101664 SS1]|uniref:GMC oxidoreductase n=1 Tax=Trametes versicolor (strain FP-101664) TaxID=717944 RepID=UPI00046241DD|nr:GMC oxidoreductase [Trametes versicolor FP-101664 SS1]EIW58409.1 GMC oxidoreductase [Trametes versicolor FP-101664 SS1]